MMRTLKPSATEAGELNQTRTTDHVPAQSTAADLSPSFAMLTTLIESYGVSGHEAPVREADLRLVPSWARPQTRKRSERNLAAGKGGCRRSFACAESASWKERTDFCGKNACAKWTKWVCPECRA
jgi:hypothetical protein